MSTRRKGQREHRSWWKSIEISCDRVSHLRQNRTLERLPSIFTIRGASEGCYWAMNDLKKDRDNRIGVDGTRLSVYYSGELARGDREQVHLGNIGLKR